MSVPYWYRCGEDYESGTVEYKRCEAPDGATYDMLVALAALSEPDMVEHFDSLVDGEAKTGSKITFPMYSGGNT